VELYTDKSKSYFANIRHDLISFLPKHGVDALLEVGAGGGDTLVEIKRLGLAKEVVGIELMRLPGTNQENSSIDEFIYGDFETLDARVSPSSFDVILCGDVLEHLVDPWKAVEKITAFLKPGGLLVVSCPNARYFEMFVKIFIKGSFEYSSSGLFDKTHLRFFCKRDLIRMLTVRNELEVNSATPSFKVNRKSRTYFFNLLTLGLLEQFLTHQYIVCAKRLA
jgi:2-polyprenyl-3-methyl-5-hydroxy-6-metoxy-1,4-benzoquinol methylase